MTTPPQWFPVVPLAPSMEEWMEALVASVTEVNPGRDRAEVVLREVLHVPLPRASEDDEPAACPRCKGTGAIRIGPGLVPWEFEYDSCPDCNGES